MPIKALPAETTRLLAASTSVTTPYAIVKELLENAIDAGATSVEIQVSSNTVDKIQVRDNGHGIDCDDFDALGRRAHTSKLKHFHELSTKGGQTLGFRGEALAAINTVAAAVHVTTRTAQDPIATRMRIKAALGGIEERRPVSAPIGTSVQVERLFEGIPVRKQQAIKGRRKSVSDIKQLLRSYALAKPYLRLLMKVAGEPAHDFQYSPSSPPTVRDAMVQLFGTNLSSHCISGQETIESYQDLPLPRGTKDLPIIIMNAIFLDSSSASFTKNGCGGAFISVDGRPIDSHRGLGKQILTGLRNYVTSNPFPGSPSSHSTANFLQLDIQCPPGSYDVNVTSLKDEMVFSDDQILLTCFENLCKKLLQHIHTPPTNLPVEQTHLNSEIDVVSRTDMARPEGEGEGEGDQDSSNNPLSSNTVCNAEPTRTNAFNGSGRPVATKLPTADPLGTFEETRRLDIRTSIRVDMERHKSNMTDEDSMTDSVTVELSSLPTLVNKFSSKRVQYNDQTTKRRVSRALGGVQDIHRYLIPRETLDFQIATDDTATEGRPPTPPSNNASGQANLGAGRSPLEPIQDVELNTVREETPPSDGFEGRHPNLHPVSEFQSNLGDLDMALMWRLPPTPRERDHGSDRLGASISPAASSARDSEVSRQRQPLLSDLTPPRPLAFQTPPSTITRVPHRGVGRLSQPAALSRPIAGPMEQHPRRTNGIRSIESPRRTRISTVQSRRPDTNRRQGTRPDIPLGSQTRMAERTSQSVANQRAHLEGPQIPSPWEQSTRSLVLEHDKQHSPGPSSQNSPSRIGGMAGPGLPDYTTPWSPWSHGAQVLLMRSPSPQRGTVSNHGLLSTESPSLVGADKVDVPEEDTVPTYAAPWARRSSAKWEAQCQNVDPRAYLIARKRSEAVRGRPRRLSTRHLPLERNTDGTRTDNLQATITFDGLEKAIERPVYDDDRPSLDFHSLADVDGVTRRLEEIVQQWVSRCNLEVDVEYTLRSTVKGKQAV